MTDHQANLAHLQQQIESASQDAGRPIGSVQLLAVSKGQPVEAIEAVAALGQRAFGENYVQEGVAKCQALAALGLEWHFIGRLQSNKAALVAEHFDVCQSVDRLRLVEALAKGRADSQAPLKVLIQMNVDDEAGKGGAAPAEMCILAAAIAAQPRLQLCGLMAIPRPEPDPKVRAQAFATLAALYEELRREHPQVDTLSMGMSDDYPEAIHHGSTLVRIGTALFGARDQGH
jgi:pyridoxal phosphate enzyme (YggS family)